MRLSARPAAALATAPAAATVVLATAVAMLLAGCGQPPDPPENPVPPAPPATSPGGGPTPPGLSPPGPPSSPGATFDPRVAIGCAGAPDADAVLAVLRAEDWLPADTEAEVVEGPLCAGSWQYAVVSVPDRDPLLVLTRGALGELELVTAGTDVCSAEVRVTAPVGIREVAGCVG